MVLASVMVEKGEEPSWFRKAYYADGDLEQLAKCGLSVDVLAIQALALHLCYEEPKGRTPSDIGKDLRAVRKHLQKAHGGLTSLRNEWRPEALKPTSSSSDQPDGSVLVEFESDPYEDILGAIDRFLSRSTDVGDQGDGRKTVLYFAIAKLVQLLERTGTQMSIPELEPLCQDLFDNVREHTEKRQGPFRYHDMLRRIPGAHLRTIAFAKRA
jgi:hypothetical protein